MVRSIEDLFPGLRGTAYRTSSPPDDDYNCIAWAAGVTNIWWWPFGDRAKTHWPDGVARTETVEAFCAAFATIGYAVCDQAEVEAGYEKVALFADAAGCPLHAARQVSEGRWTSKLGMREDIEHGLRDLEGTEYGTVVVLMKRPVGPRA